jgi:hypothetical protein
MNPCPTLAIAALLALPLCASAQPWRYEDSKGVHYTSDVNRLPPKLRDRILKAREAERARQTALGEAPPPVVPVPARRSPRAPTRPVVTERAPERGPKPEGRARAPKENPKVVVARRVAELTAKIAEAEATLLRLRRKALEVPSGMAYDARNKAQVRVEALRRTLAELRTQL